ncbi:uncharacterized protein LOC125237219 isoform X2 [Leguminivora glycinivorella]|uniref:uncharacterized protein LOC125237219 isoform X2 n=1 Tax=Leguminivora glycinivorella TaxID=1035111 RepID=UPI00200E1453|nr:uncharacterized protein LOC125237219 isoform X2 [Leguminivora glycinivorella]
MADEWVLLVFCVSSVNAVMEIPVLTTRDVNAKWLEGFRRDLLRDSYDYGPPSAAPAGRGGAGRGASSQPAAAGSRQHDAPSQELGISRRDLRDPQHELGIELDGPDSPRRPFLDNLYDLEDTLRPVYMQSNRISGARKRWSDGEENPYIEKNGIKLYKVPPNPNGRIVPRMSAEIGFARPPDRARAASEEQFGGMEIESKPRQYDNDRTEDMYRYVDRIPYRQSAYRNDGNSYRNNDRDRFSNYGDVPDGMQFRANNVRGVNIEEAAEDRNSESYEESASAEEEEDEEPPREPPPPPRDYRPPPPPPAAALRDQYAPDWRRALGRGGYGDKFAERRDRDLLADEALLSP